MTSLPVVPTKFYQVCRLCLNVVNDTNELVNLSVFGRHNAACIGTATSAQTNAGDNMIVTASSNSSSTGVIVKANSNNNNNNNNRKNEARISSPTNEPHSASNSVTNDASNNETAAAGGDGTARDDDNNNFKIDGDLHNSDILERIYTFLSITVSAHCQILSIRTYFSYFSLFHFIDVISLTRAFIPYCSLLLLLLLS